MGYTLMVGVVSFVAMVLSIAGNVLVGMKRKGAFILWGISNLMWISISFLTYVNVPQVIMYMVYLAINVWSFLSWKSDKDM